MFEIAISQKPQYAPDYIPAIYTIVLLFIIHTPRMLKHPSLIYVTEAICHELQFLQSKRPFDEDRVITRKCSPPVSEVL